MMIAVPEKYALAVGSPTRITSERQHAQYLSVLDKLANKDNPTTEEEKYAEVLMTLIEAYEAEHHSIPDASSPTALAHAPGTVTRPRFSRSPPHVDGCE